MDLRFEKDGGRTLYLDKDEYFCKKCRNKDKKIQYYFCEIRKDIVCKNCLAVDCGYNNLNHSDHFIDRMVFEKSK